MELIERGLMGRVLLAVATAVTVTVAGAAQKVDIDDYEGAIKADDLFIVDCLLPPQVRQMGQRFTYLAARQPIRTSAKDCAIRGGEYVAYDRADYQTALKVWMPAAEGGDAQAQTYVGEIYEEGLGVEPDYARAAEWYAKAAEQGHSRAMINLGALYEIGRGVAQDLPRAMNLYRQASGITDGILEYTTDEELAQRRALAAEAERLRQQVLDLTDQLASAEKTLNRRKRDLQRAQDELAETLLQLEAERMAAGQMSDEDRATLARLRDENQGLRGRLQTAETAQSALLKELRLLRSQSESAELELSRTQIELEEDRSRLQSSQAEIDALKGQLQSAAGSPQAAELEARIADSELALDVERGLFEARQAELLRELATAREALKQSRQREADLQAQVNGRDREIDDIRNSLASAQGSLLEAQLQLASADAGSDLVKELQQEILERELEIADYQQTTQELLGQLGVSQVSDASTVGINMISPEVGVARGTRSVTLLSELAEYELIGRVSPRDELLAFRVNDRDALTEIDDYGLFNVRLALDPGGQTPVNIEAVRRDGSKSSESFLIQKEAPAAVAQRSTSKRFRNRLRSDLGSFHALVIGNNNYANHETLGTAINDAQGVADILRNRYGYNVRLLTNATRDRIVVELAELTEKLGKNDNLLIYYAGHGVLEGDEGYWLGVDAGAARDSSWIGNAQISDFISEMKAKHVLVVADSCYAGTLSGSAIRPIPIEIEDQDLLFISRVRARTVLTSGGLQPVLDEGGDGHSIFGGSFIRAISGNGDVMEGYRLFDSVRSDVETRSRLARVRQSPEYTALKFAGHEGSEFFFLPSRQAASRSERILL